ncbi:MAG: hypothetical protein ACOYVJ_06225 [Nitrospirota bacterium]
MKAKISANPGSLTDRKISSGKSQRKEERCRALDIGLESFVVCLEETPWTCTHSFHFGGRHFCKNPSRIAAAKESGP